MTLISNFPAFPVQPHLPDSDRGADDVVENVIVERFVHRGGKSSTPELPTTMALLKFPKNAQEPNTTNPMTEWTDGRTDGHLFSACFLQKMKTGRTSDDQKDKKRWI